jgi:hypothetical protein
MNRNQDLSARSINSVLSFSIVVNTDFKLTGLDLEILALNEGTYKIYEGKEPALICKIEV